MPSTRPAATKLRSSAACTKAVNPARLSMVFLLIADANVRTDRNYSLFFFDRAWLTLAA